MAENQDRSRQPDKQRKAQARAPQHRRREMMSAHLSEDLMLEYDRRSIALRTGDQVEIMRGDFAGHQGEVLEIDYNDQEIEIDGAVNRSADGSQVARPIHPSNVRVTDLDLTDPRRRAKIERKGVTVEEPEPEPEPEEAEVEEEEPEPEPAEPAEGAKGPDVAPEPEPPEELEEPEPDVDEVEEAEADEPEEEPAEAEPAEDEADETETDEESTEGDEPEPPDEGAETDETETDDTDDDTDKEGSA